MELFERSRGMEHVWPAAHARLPERIMTALFYARRRVPASFEAPCIGWAGAFCPRECGAFSSEIEASRSNSIRIISGLFGCDCDSHTAEDGARRQQSLDSAVINAGDGMADSIRPRPCSTCTLFTGSDRWMDLVLAIIGELDKGVRRDRWRICWPSLIG